MLYSENKDRIEAVLVNGKKMEVVDADDVTGWCVVTIIRYMDGVEMERFDAQFDNPVDITFVMKRPH